jgi:hypothetical protein
MVGINKPPKRVPMVAEKIMYLKIVRSGAFPRLILFSIIFVNNGACIVFENCDMIIIILKIDAEDAILLVRVPTILADKLIIPIK